MGFERSTTPPNELTSENPKPSCELRIGSRAQTISDMGNAHMIAINAMRVLTGARQHAKPPLFFSPYDANLCGYIF
jgi:hypothetical protein